MHVDLKRNMVRPAHAGITSLATVKFGSPENHVVLPSEANPAREPTLNVADIEEEAVPDVEVLIAACRKAAITDEIVEGRTIAIVNAMEQAFALYRVVYGRPEAIARVRTEAGTKYKGRHKDPALLCTQFVARPNDLKAMKAVSDYACMLRFARIKEIPPERFVEFASRTTLREARRGAPSRASSTRVEKPSLELRVRKSGQLPAQKSNLEAPPEVLLALSDCLSSNGIASLTDLTNWLVNHIELMSNNAKEAGT